MPKREYDTSRAKCDTCGKPYQEGDAVYGLADKYDPDIEDRDVLISFRHWDCHRPVGEVLADLRDKLRKAEGILSQLRSRRGTD